MSDTPRTDKECEKTNGDYYLEGFVDADFARELEREQARRTEVAPTIPDKSRPDEAASFHLWWAAQGMKGEEHAKLRWSAWNGWLARSQCAPSPQREKP